MRTAWAAGGLVAILAVAAVGFGVQSARNADEADRQAAFAAEQAQIAENNADRAAEEAERANSEAGRANQEAERANTNAAAAEESAALALSRELAASAVNVLEDDPELSVLLALASIDAAPAGSSTPIESTVALREAIYNSTILDRHRLRDGERIGFGDLSPDGSHVAYATAQSLTVRSLKIGSWETRWIYQEPESPDCAWDLFYTADGTRVLVSVVDSALNGCADLEDDGVGPRLIVLDADTGTKLDEWVPGGPCPGFGIGPESPDGSMIPVLTSDDATCGFEGEWRLDLLDPATFDVLRSMPVRGMSNISWSADSRFVSSTAFNGGGAVVYDVTTAELAFEMTEARGGDVYLATLSPDGARLAAMNFRHPSVMLFDVADASIVDQLAGLGDQAFFMDFDQDGTRLVGGSRSAESAIWDLASGEVAQRMATGATVVVRFGPDGDEVVHLSQDQITVWDASGGTIGEFDTRRIGAFVASIVANERAGYVTILGRPDGPVDAAFDPATGVLTGAEFHTDNLTTVLSDGRLVAVARSVEVGEDGRPVTRGPIVAWDPNSGQTTEFWGCVADMSELVQEGPNQLNGPCADRRGEWFDFDRAFVDPNGSTLLLTSTFGELQLFDAATLEPRSAYDLGTDGGVMAFGDGWVVVSSEPTGVATVVMDIEVLDIGSGDSLYASPGLAVARSPLGDRLAIHDAPGSITIVDTATWEPVASSRFGDGRFRSMKFSFDGGHLATVETNGFVRVWDGHTGAETHRIPVPDVRDLHWLDDTHLMLGTAGGLWTKVTLDENELRGLAVSRLTRGFSDEECASYRLDPCPTLEDLRGD